MPTSPEQYQAAVITNLEKKTGKTMAEWVAIARAAGIPKFMETVKWLKEVHGLGHTGAYLVADQAQRGDASEPTADEYLAAQYEGAKAALKPVYERLAEAARELGEDVSLAPRKTYVALIRGKQFAVIQPATKSRVDLGLILPGVAPTERLVPAKGTGSGRTTHVLGLTSPAEVDEEVLGWLKAAYEGAL